VEFERDGVEWCGRGAVYVRSMGMVWRAKLLWVLAYEIRHGLNSDVGSVEDAVWLVLSGRVGFDIADKGR
jgi:hypothetical protein